MRSQRVLFVLHDAGGTVPPTLAVAAALRANGHRVAVLSQPSVRERAEAQGCDFTAFSGLPDYDRRVPLEEQLDLTVPALAGAAPGDDLVAVAEQFRPDVVVADPNLAGCLAAAAVLRSPSAVLLHSMYSTFVDTWFGDIWPLLIEPINQARRHFGLGEADSWAGLFDDHDLLLSPVPPAFDAPASRKPRVPLHHVGFLAPVPAPPSPAAEDGRLSRFPPGEGPAVLVGLSTTYQRQELLLRTIIDGLGALPVRALVSTGGHDGPGALAEAPNVAVTPFVAHAEVLGETDVMVTHAGLGTVAAALTAGVPMVCTPIGRDQPLNAQRVRDVGAGVVVEHPTAEAIAQAVLEVAGNGSYARSADGMAAASREAGGAARAAAEILGLAR